MAITPTQAQSDRDEFAASFLSDDPVKTVQTEDEAFGITPESAETNTVGAAEPAVAEASEQGVATEDKPVEMPGVDAAASGSEGAAGNDDADTAPAVAIVVEPVVEGDAPANDEPAMSEKDVQREKSWEGRLKAREAELKAREEALVAREAAPAAEAGEPTETAGQDAAEPVATEAIEAAAEKVESGELTAEQAVATLSQDFGEDFTKMLGVLIDARASEIAGRTADEKVAGVSKSLDGLVGELVETRAQDHYESISDAHEDFLEIGQSPEFKAYIDAMPEDDKAKAEHTIANGSARQIVKLLNAYKASLAKPEPEAEPEAKPAEPDPAQESAMDAAEGVRSSGLKLPEKPEMSQNYEEAWEKF